MAVALEGLQKAGIKFQDENQTVLDVAALNQIKCQDVYQAMVPAENSGGGTSPERENP